MVVPAAEETRLDSRDVTQEVVDLRAAVKGSAADVVLRQDGCGGGDSRRRHWNSGRCHDDFFHDNCVVLVGIGHIREATPEQKTDHRRRTPAGFSLRGSVHYLARNREGQRKASRLPMSAKCLEVTDEGIQLGLRDFIRIKCRHRPEPISNLRANGKGRQRLIIESRT